MGIFVRKLMDKGAFFFVIIIASIFAIGSSSFIQASSVVLTEGSRIHWENRDIVLLGRANASEVEQLSESENNFAMQRKLIDSLKEKEFTHVFWLRATEINESLSACGRPSVVENRSDKTDSRRLEHLPRLADEHYDLQNLPDHQHELSLPRFIQNSPSEDTISSPSRAISEKNSVDEEYQTQLIKIEHFRQSNPGNLIFTKYDQYLEHAKKSYEQYRQKTEPQIHESDTKSILDALKALAVLYDFQRIYQCDEKYTFIVLWLPTDIKAIESIFMDQGAQGLHYFHTVGEGLTESQMNTLLITSGSRRSDSSLRVLACICCCLVGVPVIIGTIAGVLGGCNGTVSLISC